ncbi:BREX-3 system P-loop-containing protein BrxF [uncultured Sphingomonas sp.]|uniref:BREX-3 system P-loop-containing protein BrxF n=1 Tax=uncultured Sphingomonas sp. TaxID=158754 RepID=UPI0026024D2B|nr:BREX-3 system P-loop-containing protein BrxF [uncultured Sphingomonas sp.]
MIDHRSAARDAKRLLDATGMSGGKPVLLVGDDDDRRVTLEALSELVGVLPINLNVALAQALIDAAGTRADVGAIIAAMQPASPFLLLDRIQILLLPQLRTNATDVLCRVARRRAVCASWPGRLDQGRLRYADPDHPECLDEDATRALVLDLSTNEGTYR